MNFDSCSRYISAEQINTNKFKIKLEGAWFLGDAVKFRPKPLRKRVPIFGLDGCNKILVGYAAVIQGVVIGAILVKSEKKMEFSSYSCFWRNWNWSSCISYTFEYADY